MAEKLQQFINCRILRDHKIVKEDLWVRNGKIVNPEKVFFEEKITADVKIDCNGAIIAPGFIDLQINGGYGFDFSFNTEDVEKGVNVVAKGLLSSGVTAFCPTVVTSPKQVYHKVLPKIQKRRGDANGATILGIHTEGPFISTEKKGAHPIEFIQKLEKGFQTMRETYGKLENIKIVTLAPELEHAGDVIESLVSKGIAVSLGHSMADLNCGELAVQKGATLITHLFNAMLPFHHRDPGLVGLLTSDRIPDGQTVYFGIIADWVHTHPAALRIAYRAHPNGLILVTDAISAMGLSEGKHNIGQFSVEIRDDEAYVAGTDTLCGSIATMDKCVKLFYKATGCSKEYALEAASLHPAVAMGISREKGTLNFGGDADFILLSDELDVLQTWISGECVYKKL